MLKGALCAALVVLVLAYPRERERLGVDRYHEAVAYSDIGLTAPEEELTDIVEAAFGDAGRTPPQFDPNIALACKRLCEVLDCTTIEGVQAWEPQTIQFTLRTFGITDAFYFPLIAKVEGPADAGELIIELIRDDLLAMKVNRYGLALDLGDRNMFAAIFTRRLVQLGPFPRHTEPGANHLLWGGMLQDSASPVFILATPDGGVLQQTPHESKGLLWNQVYFPDEPGEYLIELLVNSDGPQVASLFPVYVGVPVPPHPVFKLFPGIDESGDAEDLERQVLVLINRERKKRGVDPCRQDTRLSFSARAYSRVMAAAGRLTHVLPKRVLPASFEYGENISLSTSLHAAHANLMASPSHRRNILDSDIRHCGVGVVVQETGASTRLLYITQRFSRIAPEL